GRVPTSRATQRRTHTEPALREIQPVAHQAADAVELDPAHVRLIDAALINQILHQTSDGIVSQRSHDRGVHAETSLQTARDVVLAPTFPHLKVACGRHAPIARIEAQHYFAEAHQIPTASVLRSYFQSVLA